jgi:hypothetical protein
MRGKLQLVLLSLVCLLAPVASAQDAPSFVWVGTVRTQIGSQQAYEAGAPEILKAFKAKGLKVPIFASTSMEEPGTYSFAMPIASWAEFGEESAKIQAAYESAAAVFAKTLGTITSWTQEMWVARPDLSYRPAKPRLQDSEMGFSRIILVYPQADASYDEAFGEANALRAKHALGTGTEVYELAMGADGPAYAVILGGKDASDFYAQSAKETAAMGADWQAYLQKNGPKLRRVEYQSSVARPDLGYTP